MAATVTASSPWGKKPGAWALDAEEHEDELQQMQRVDSPPQNDAAFPSLSVAAAVKQPKKNKKMSLAEFNTAPEKPSPRVEVLSLPTGPRQRSAEELEQGGRLGGGFRSYGRGGEDGDSRGGRFSSREGGRDREREKEFTPSRADEVDDWSKSKRAVGGGGGGGLERRERGGGFFEDSRAASKADESDNWLASKATIEPRRFERRGSFESLSRGREDSDNWGRRKEVAPIGGADSDNWGQRKEAAPIGGADLDNWGRSKGESNGNGTAARPRLVLQPRTVPSNGNGDVIVEKPKEISPFGAARPREEILAEKGKDLKEIDEQLRMMPSNGNGDVIVEKPKGTNPFGAARPREEVLAEKGKDWKEIDEKLEAVKIGGGAKDAERGERREGYGWRKDHTRFGDDGPALERSWRKPEASNSEAIPDSSASSVNEHAPENGDSTEDGVAEAN